MNEFTVPSADEIFGQRPAPQLWPKSDEMVAVGIELLPTVVDALEADYIERLLLVVVDLREELQSIRLVLSQALTVMSAQHVELARLLDSRDQLLAESRMMRKQATSLAGAQ